MSNCFFSAKKAVLLNCIPILYPSRFMLGEKAACNCSIPDSNDQASFLLKFQAKIYSVRLSTFKFHALNVARYSPRITQKCATTYNCHNWWPQVGKIF